MDLHPLKMYFEMRNVFKPGRESNELHLQIKHLIRSKLVFNSFIDNFICYQNEHGMQADLFWKQLFERWEKIYCTTAIKAERNGEGKKGEV